MHIVFTESKLRGRKVGLITMCLTDIFKSAALAVTIVIDIWHSIKQERDLQWLLNVILGLVIVFISPIMLY